jgi:hypothetical protein
MPETLSDVLKEWLRDYRTPGTAADPKRYASILQRAQQAGAAVEYTLEQPQQPNTPGSHRVRLRFRIYDPAEPPETYDGTLWAPVDAAMLQQIEAGSVPGSNIRPKRLEHGPMGRIGYTRTPGQGRRRMVPSIRMTSKEERPPNFHPDNEQPGNGEFTCPSCGSKCHFLFDDVSELLMAPAMQCWCCHTVCHPRPHPG